MAAGGDQSPAPAPAHGARRDVKQRRKGEARKTFTSEEWAMQTWCLGGFLPGKGVLVAAPPRRGLGRRRGMRRWDRKARPPPAPRLRPSQRLRREKHPPHPRPSETGGSASQHSTSSRPQPSRQHWCWQSSVTSRSKSFFPVCFFCRRLQYFTKGYLW